MIENPIFIIGTERSGSNLLRLILDTHSKIDIPHPPHVMRDFSPVLSSYGDLSLDYNFKRLSYDVAVFVNHHFSPWPFKIESEEIIKNVKEKTLYAIYVYLYEKHMKLNGKIRFGCKSTFMHNQIDEIIKHHKTPKFLHLVRDPRDVASSAKDSIFSHNHPYKEALLWKKEQENIEAAKATYNPNYFLTIRYEDLTKDSENEVKRIMDFLEEKFEQSQLNYFERSEAKKLAGLTASWGNVNKPINTSSIAKYKKHLSESDIKLIELDCIDLMKKYSYHLENSNPIFYKNILFDLKVEAIDYAYFIRNEVKSLINDKNFHLRWSKKFLIKKIKYRNKLGVTIGKQV